MSREEEQGGEMRVQPLPSLDGPPEETEGETDAGYSDTVRGLKVSQPPLCVGC